MIWYMKVHISVAFASRALHVWNHGVALKECVRQLRNKICYSVFSHQKTSSVVQIYKELVFVYGWKCMSEQMVRCWKEDFIKGRENVHAMNNARDGQCMPLGMIRQFSQFERASMRIADLLWMKFLNFCLQASKLVGHRCIGPNCWNSGVNLVQSRRFKTPHFRTRLDRRLAHSNRLFSATAGPIFNFFSLLESWEYDGQYTNFILISCGDME